MEEISWNNLIVIITMVVYSWIKLLETFEMLFLFNWKVIIIIGQEFLRKKKRWNNINCPNCSYCDVRVFFLSAFPGSMLDDETLLVLPLSPPSLASYLQAHASLLYCGMNKQWTGHGMNSLCTQMEWLRDCWWIPELNWRSGFGSCSLKDDVDVEWW